MRLSKRKKLTKPIMSNNQTDYNFSGIGGVIKTLLIPVTGPLNWFFSLILQYLFNYMMKKGIYLIDVSTTTIKTNMDRDTWKQIQKSTFLEAEKGVDHERGKELNKMFISAFSNFVVYSKVRDDRNS
jgi:hypothetical protein